MVTAARQRRLRGFAPATSVDGRTTDIVGIGLPASATVEAGELTEGS